MLLDACTAICLVSSLFDCQRPQTLLQASRRRPKFNTQLSSLDLRTVLSAQLRAALSTNRFGGSALVARPTAKVASPFGTFPRVIAGELGGGEGVRTPDLRLAKPALCQTELRPQSLKGWLRGRDLNPRPLGYEPNELPDCSTPRHPNFKAFKWWAWVDSNYRPHAYQACALTN